MLNSITVIVVEVHIARTFLLARMILFQFRRTVTEIPTESSEGLVTQSVMNIARHSEVDEDKLIYSFGEHYVLGLDVSMNYF